MDETIFRRDSGRGYGRVRPGATTNGVYRRRGTDFGLDFDDDDIDVLLVGCGVFQETPNDNNDGETTTKPTPRARYR